MSFLTDDALLIAGAAALLIAFSLALWRMAVAHKTATNTARTIVDATDAHNEVQERLAFLVEASPAVVFSARTCGYFCILYISANVRTRLGYEPRDFTENPSFWIDHVHPEDRARALMDLTGLKELDNRTSEYRFQRKDGSYRWLRSEMRLVGEEGGSGVQVVGSMFDITGLRRAEERFQRLVESAPDAMVISDASGHIILVNAESETLFGYPRDELRGTPVERLIPEWFRRVERPGPADAPAGFLVSGASGYHEMEVRRKDGLEVPAEISSRLVSTEDGDMVVTTIRDISMRRESARELERMSLVAAKTDNAVVITDKDGTVEWINAGYTKMTGLASEEVVGRKTADLLAEAVIVGDSHGGAHKGGSEPGPPFSGEILHRHKDGHGTWVAVNYTEVLDDDGEVARIIGIGADITDRKHAEAEVARLAGFPGLNPGPVLEADGTGRITYFNEAARRELAEEISTRALPAELARLVERCLEEGEDILQQEASIGEKTLLWTFHPNKKTHRVQLYATDVSDLKKAELARRASEAEYRTLVQQAPVGIYRSSSKGRFLSANPAFVEMLGYASEEEVLCLDITDDIYVTPEDRRQLVDLADEQRGGDDSIPSFTVTWKRRDGTPIRVRLAGRVTAGWGGKVTGFEMFAEDVTQQGVVEQRLRQSQRLEALGLLAGGVAHDFNNILSVIILEAQLGLSGLGTGDMERTRFGEIKLAAERAAELTSQLLAFSRKQVVHTEVLRMNDVVIGMRKMLGRLISEDIFLTTDLDEGLSSVAADKGQLEQILTNLIVNSRDAMPSGGEMVIRTAMVTPSAKLRAAYPGFTASPHVILEVKDTGSGIPDDVKAKIFDPFFTTKQAGKGTGFGLATVYGSVKKMNGFVDVESEVGVGTTVRIYLPVVGDPGTAIHTPGSDVSLPSACSDEVVMVVEDNPQLRRILIQMLKEHGYTVLSAMDGVHAIERIEARDGHVHLLLTDVVMPRMGGPELARTVEERWPGITVVFMSGYTSDGDLQERLVTDGAPFLRKPFSAESLSATVRGALSAS